MKHKLPSIYFLHTPKTAGSSLSEIIHRAYPQELVMPAYEIPELLKLNRAEINRFKCFTGHFGTGLFSLLDNNIPCITMLRDPFERAVSFISFSKRILSSSALSESSDKFIQKKILKRDLNGFAKHPVNGMNISAIDQYKQIFLNADLRQIVNDPLMSKAIENYQALYLGYNVNLNNSLDSPNPILNWSTQTAIGLDVFFLEQLLSGLDMNKIVDNAKQRLDKMEVVGIAEHFDDSTRLICNFLGVKTPKTFPTENISPEKLSLGGLTYRESGQIPQDVIKRIDELTVCDQEIYEYGKTLFARQLRNKNRKFFFF